MPPTSYSRSSGDDQPSDALFAHDEDEDVEDEDIAIQVRRQIDVNQSQLDLLEHMLVIERVHQLLLVILLFVVLFVGALGVRFAYVFVAAQIGLTGQSIESYAYPLAVVFGVLCILVFFAYIIMRVLLRVGLKRTLIRRLIGDQGEAISEARNYLKLLRKAETPSEDSANASD